MKRPSTIMIRKSLLEALFDPRSPGPGLGIIIDEGNSNYFEIRAIELIKEARLMLNSEQLYSREHRLEYYENNITQAISLLALAKVIQDD